MKTLFTFALCFFGFSLIAPAQVKKPIESVKISVPNAQCEECKTRIEEYMKREEGVAKIVVDYRRKIATVTYSTERTNVENIKTAIANIGYDADDVKADEEAYKRLPKQCKKTEDGGHPKKK